MNTSNGIPHTIPRKGACVRDVLNEYKPLTQQGRALMMHEASSRGCEVGGHFSPGTHGLRISRQGQTLKARA